MSESYIGEIRMVGFNFAPLGWAKCEGQILPIAQYEALFTLIGTTYGGNGQTTFALPNLQGRIPIHKGQGPGLGFYIIGQSGGTETVTLTMGSLPNHRHQFVADTQRANQSTPGTAVTLAQTSGGVAAYLLPEPPFTTMNAQTLAPVGGSQPHENRMPYLCVNFIIALEGVFPSLEF